MNDFRPNKKNLRQREAVVGLTCVPFGSWVACIICKELVENRVAMSFIEWSPLSLVLLACPLLPLSLNVPEIWKLAKAVKPATT